MSKGKKRATKQRAIIRAALIAERRTKPSPPRDPIGPCFACGRSFVQTESRFCSDRCRASFDAGARPYEPPLTSREIMERFPVSDKILGQGNRGPFIICPGCNNRFESVGLRHCSKACRDKAERHENNIASMGPLEYEDRRRICGAEGCANRIPLFRKGRAVSKAAKYCSAKCANRARKHSEAPSWPKPVLDAPNAKKPLILLTQRMAPLRPPMTPRGGAHERHCCL